MTFRLDDWSGVTQRERNPWDGLILTIKERHSRDTAKAWLSTLSRSRSTNWEWSMADLLRFLDCSGAQMGCWIGVYCLRSTLISWVKEGLTGVFSSPGLCGSSTSSPSWSTAHITAAHLQLVQVQLRKDQAQHAQTHKGVAHRRWVLLHVKHSPDDSKISAF